MTENELNTIISDYTNYLNDLREIAKIHHHETSGKISLPEADFYMVELNVIAAPNGEGGAYLWWCSDADDDEFAQSSPIFTLEQTDKLKEMLMRFYAATDKFSEIEEPSESDVGKLIDELDAICSEYGDEKE